MAIGEYMLKEIESRENKGKSKQKRKKGKGRIKNKSHNNFFFFFNYQKNIKNIVEPNVQKYYHVFCKHKPDELLYIFSKFLKESV